MPVPVNGQGLPLPLLREELDELKELEELQEELVAEYNPGTVGVGSRSPIPGFPLSFWRSRSISFTGPTIRSYFFGEVFCGLRKQKIDIESGVIFAHINQA